MRAAGHSAARSPRELRGDARRARAAAARAEAARPESRYAHRAPSPARAEGCHRLRAEEGRTIPLSWKLITELDAARRKSSRPQTGATTLSGRVHGPAAHWVLKRPPLASSPGRAHSAGGTRSARGPSFTRARATRQATIAVSGGCQRGQGGLPVLLRKQPQPRYDSARTGPGPSEGGGSGGSASKGGRRLGSAGRRGRSGETRAARTSAPVPATAPPRRPAQRSLPAAAGRPRRGRAPEPEAAARPPQTPTSPGGVRPRAVASGLLLHGSGSASPAVWRGPPSPRRAAAPPPPRRREAGTRGQEPPPGQKRSPRRAAPAAPAAAARRPLPPEMHSSRAASAAPRAGGGGGGGSRGRTKELPGRERPGAGEGPGRGRGLRGASVSSTGRGGLLGVRWGSSESDCPLGRGDLTAFPLVFGSVSPKPHVCLTNSPLRPGLSRQTL